MKITKLKIRTSKGEILKLNNVTSINFGIVTDDKWGAKTDEIFITSDSGHNRFFLDEICVIEFNLEKENIGLHIESRGYEKEKEDV